MYHFAWGHLGVLKDVILESLLQDLYWRWESIPNENITVFGQILSNLSTSQSRLTDELLTEQLPCPSEHSRPVSTGLCSMTPQFCTHKDCWGLQFPGRGPRGNPWTWPFFVAVWIVKFFYDILKKRIACSSTIHLHIIHIAAESLFWWLLWFIILRNIFALGWIVPSWC